MYMKLYGCDILLEQLVQDLANLTATLRPCIQEAHAVMRQRPLARQRHLAPADPPHSREGLMWGATRARGHQRRALAV
jgi:hypothetical protein